MGFKSMGEYNDQRFGNFFRLQNDLDSADVVIMYRNTHDVMLADTHYIKTDSYSGYVTCTGTKTCPACTANVRVQPKLFVPMYVIATSDAAGSANCLQFWDRTLRFQPQLVNDVFRGYPNPSEFIFRITRHGAAGDINTVYDIRAICPNSNPETSYDAICSKFGITFPDCFNLVCKEVDEFNLASMMTSHANRSYGSDYAGGQGGSSYGGNYGGGNYGATPRGSRPTPPIGEGGMIPGTQIPYTTPQMQSGPSMPSVPISAPTPGAAPGTTPDPNDIPFGGGSDSDADGTADPMITNEDIDTTDLNF